MDKGRTTQKIQAGIYVEMTSHVMTAWLTDCKPKRVTLQRDIIIKLADKCCNATIRL
jgi:hypothetical protein